MLAHMPVTGLGEFAGGLLHPIFTPAHDLLLLSLGLLIGQRRPLELAKPVAALAGSAALGLCFAPGVPQAALICLALVVAGLVAVGLRWPLWALVGAAGGAGLLIGLDSSPDLTGFAAFKMLAGVWVSLILCTVNIAFYASLLPPVRWAEIAVRVVGSWVVAIAVLMLAFALRRVP